MPPCRADCKHPGQQLWNAHICPNCNTFIHILCVLEAEVTADESKAPHLSFLCIPCWKKSKMDSQSNKAASLNEDNPTAEDPSFIAGNPSVEHAAGTTATNTENNDQIIPPSKKKKLGGGFSFSENEALTPDGLKRSDFRVPPIDGKKKTLEELTAGSESLFTVGRRFLSRTHLRDALWSYGLGNFIVCFNGQVLECNCGKKDIRKKKEKEQSLMTDKPDVDSAPKAKKMRACNVSSLKVDCPYKVNFTFVDSINKQGEVRITSAIHEHKNHDPTIEAEFQAIIIKSHSPFTDISDKAKILLASYLSMNPYASCKDIRAHIQLELPRGMTLSSIAIGNIRNRIQKLIKGGTLEGDINTLNRLILDDSVWKEIDLSPSIILTDASEIASDLHNDLHKFQNDTSDSFDLERYLQLIGQMDNNFTFSLSKNSDERYNGCCWMTGVMRRNFELYGHYISLDMMKRELTRHNWCYVAVTSRNEFCNVVVCLEGMMSTEDFDSYKFICSNLLKMAPGRAPSKVSIVSGDGFFNKNMIQRLGFRKANFILDSYHLFEAIKHKLGLPLYQTVSRRSPSFNYTIAIRLTTC